MGKGNQIEVLAGARGAKTLSDDLVEFSDRHELRDRQFAHRDDEMRAENFQLAIEPGRTVRDFLGVGNAVASAWGFAGETAADCGEIYPSPHFLFIQAGRLLEPPEKSFASSPGKRFPGQRFAHAWRLPNEQDLAHDRAARDRRRVHPRAAPAIAQTCDMSGEPRLSVPSGRHA